MVMRIILVPIIFLAASAYAEPDSYDSAAKSATFSTDRFVYTYDHDAAHIPDELSPYAKYSADDPAGEFDIERAAHFIDGASVKWGNRYGCVTCHTNGHYLMVPPKIFGNRPAAAEVRNFAEDWINSWDDIGLPRTDVVVAPAAFLTINNMQMDGELRPTTVRALGEAWALQSAEGHWPNWVKCNWPPFEQDDHYGVTLVAVAMGMAPESYTSTEPARTGIRRLLEYLEANEPEEVHHRAMLLWAGKYHEGLVSVEERRQWIDELLSLQKESGGWAAGDLGRWRQRAPESGGIDHLDQNFVEDNYPPVRVAPEGDGYGTGFVMYALLQAGVPASHPQMQKGIDWLKGNQQADGKWFTNSLRNEVYTPHFLTHTGTTFVLKVLAETDNLK